MLERTRKIYLFKIKDFWFNKRSFFKSNKYISLLWTNENLDKKDFNILIPLKTVYIDLTQDLEKIFLDFKKKSCRYEVNKAKKLDLAFNKAISEKYYKKTYTFFLEFCKKKGIPSPIYNEWKKMEVFYVTKENKIICVSSFISNNKSIIRYKHGGSTYEFPCMEYMLFEIMKYFKEKGYKIFDMGGIDKDKYPAHYKFKTKFGGKEGDFFCYIKGNNILVNILLKLLNVFVNILFIGSWNKFINFLNFLKVIK